MIYFLFSFSVAFSTVLSTVISTEFSDVRFVTILILLCAIYLSDYSIQTSRERKCHNIALYLKSVRQATTKKLRIQKSPPFVLQKKVGYGRIIEVKDDRI